MGKKRKKSNRSKKSSKNSLLSQLPDGVRRGLLFIILIAASAMIILSAFGLSGMAGVYIDQFMALIFGWTRLVAALALLIFAFGVVTPRSERITVWTYVGLILGFMSGTALINLFAFRSQELSERLIAANGGYLGLVLQQLGMSTVGFWGTFVILAAFIAISIVLLFHGSYSDFQDLLERLRPDEEDEEDEEEEDEDEEVEEEEEEDEEPKRKKSRIRDFATRSKAKSSEEAVLTKRRKNHVAFSLDLLEDRPLTPDSGNIDKNSNIIQNTFENFGIDTEVVDVAVGPTITQYAIRPAQGIKLSRIVGLQSDLALALAAHPIRIEAPIPGKSLVGIEVPNKSIATVALRTILEAKSFKKSDAELTFALGMDVGGKSWVTGLEKTPHLLVAGATGSGKSVCLNNIIVSLLYQHGPDSLKLVLVDPKRVELPAYKGIPHLLVPPITKSDDAINALKWTVREMERRLDVLSAAGARNIAGYNKKSPEQMPYIVFVIDELADLMAQASREVETLIVRIAQMARAVGIHLILATQRPSVDVITGTIKANVPTRIAFAVASQTDSRTILDHGGAEKLLGRGDMLFMSPNLAKARRMQGAFLSDKEIKNVVDALKAEEAPDYNYDVTENQKGGSTEFGKADDDDPLMEDAVEAILAAGKASTSLLQRRLKIGYSRAARIMDMLEDRDVIGPQQGSKPREVLIESIGELYDDGSSDDEYEDEPDEEEPVEEEYEEDETEDDVDEDLEEDTEEEYEEEEDDQQE
ncbi:MAG TPA: DNA translocase FtsK 4TM domain-containing protein [Patescibacteria group bacterium]|nr:DNA translocase FtsK 4TM domain-containing protein [Patescibacteria group bacterium]